MGSHICKVILNTKVLDFIQFGGPGWTRTNDLGLAGPQLRMHLLLPDAPEIVQPRWTLGVAAQCRPLQGTSPEAGAFMVCPAAPSRSVFRLGEPWLREGGGLSIAAASTYFPTASTSSSKLSPLPLMRRMACATGGPVTTSTRPHSFTPPCWVSSNQ